MTHENIFERLDEREPLANRKQLLHEYLMEQLKAQEQHPEQGEQIAYEIAGLLATNLAATLADDDPYMEVLYLAGELELPEQHRDSSASWEALRELVRNLPQ
ncbi:hypothetical protein AB0K60_32385 [Thermopolyspora sp. NPDC052614]|uniref:hypothetical protein n=1 Tax=Thermopolyspora sp. NPDC052614 TaxID=3155682 RepID=UPI00341D72C3